MNFARHTLNKPDHQSRIGGMERTYRRFVPVSCSRTATQEGPGDLEPLAKTRYPALPTLTFASHRQQKAQMVPWRRHE
jgi:hypothetical protein